MKHLFKKGTNPSKPTLLLLHGTGGTETDLLPLAEMVDAEASVLSVRGNIVENGMPRYFKRLAEGVFDIENLKEETKNLADFIDEASKKYGFDRDNVVAIGYSNGANIAGSLLFRYQDVLKGAILHHPMVPLRGLELPDLSQVPVFIGAGENDPICAPQESKDLKQLLEEAGSSVDIDWGQHGHSLTQKEVLAAAQWYAENFA
ncbi:alpha/beta hydrolase [Desemzia sp. RIT804]|uniref:alpha/beta hydrolase n=1 Tax=Desemzia sp. RIT 804 TaxID=2810209 RepID=UPI0019504FCA|nr:alpha/beta hydrolase [Desemzia sp. RIT 804]MBM6613950.1 alpha/beta hydrolase [Desemzia sp. RIT 804]